MENVNEIEDNSNGELKNIIAGRQKDVLWQILSFLEIALPHKNGDNSLNEKNYSTLRSKVLRVGNDAVRDLDGIFDSYVSFKMHEYVKKNTPGIETVLVDFRSKYKILKKGEVQ